MSVIEITDREDLRVGDYATFTYKGHEFSGKTWSDDLRMYIGSSLPLRTHNGWTPSLTFVRATREVPDLPTEPGSVILVTEVRGERLDEPVAAFREKDNYWYAATATFDGRLWHLPEHITGWTPAKVVPA